MSLYSVLSGKQEQRSYTDIKNFMQNEDVFGASISESTALRISAVYAAVNIVSETLARVPVLVKQRTDNGDAIRPDHYLNELLSIRPNKKQSSVVFRQAMQGQVLLRGNGFAYIERTRGGKAEALHFLRRDEVSIQRIEQNSLEEEVVYMIPKFGITALAQDMIWIPAFCVNDFEALSPIEYAKVMLGGAYAAMDFNAQSYKKGGFFKGVLTIVGKLGSDNKTPATRAKEIGDQFDQMYSGGNTPVLYDGNTYTPVNLRQRDLQFIEYMKYTVEDIGRIFNTPLSKLKSVGSAAQSSMESQQLEFITDTMEPWFAKWENELTYKLLSKDERDNGFYITFDSRALSVGDLAALGDFYTKQFYLGALSPDEIRLAEGRMKREGGDQFFSGVNLMTQEQVILQTEKMKNEVKLGKKQAEAPLPTPGEPTGGFGMPNKDNPKRKNVKTDV